MNLSDRVINVYNKTMPQNYQAINRGEMFVPRGGVPSGMPIALATTPYMGPVNVSPVPLIYRKPTTNTDKMGGIYPVTLGGVIK